MNVNNIIIWGHKLHSHTHSYIHNAFFIAFKKLGYDTYWFDDNDDTSNFDFSNSLFITEHQVDNKIPKRKDCLYFVHFVDPGKYDELPNENIIELKCVNRDMISDKNENPNIVFTPITDNKFEFFSKGKHYQYYTMWGTDIFPEDIQCNIDNLSEISKKINPSIFNFVGHMTEPWCIAHNACQSINMQFIKSGATFNQNHPNNKSIEENINQIQSSSISPAFQQREQTESKYIPCRIFKNISYGRMGITNNPGVNELFDNRLIYNDNIIECMNIGFEFEKRTDKLLIIKDLMEYVRDNHTYIQRLESIKIFINKYTNFKI
tara:strand:+ start:3129 stop:4088 length:960 start_codon:yes stop_codon:yes gene_type:complete